MKKTIARILRRWASHLAPEEQQEDPYFEEYFGTLIKLKAAHQYPKGTHILDFDSIKGRFSLMLAQSMIKEGVVLFTINEDDPIVDSIVAEVHVQRPFNFHGDKEV